MRGAGTRRRRLVGAAALVATVVAAAPSAGAVRAPDPAPVPVPAAPDRPVQASLAAVPGRVERYELTVANAGDEVLTGVHATGADCGRLPSSLAAGASVTVTCARPGSGGSLRVEVVADQGSTGVSVPVTTVETVTAGVTGTVRRAGSPSTVVAGAWVIATDPEDGRVAGVAVAGASGGYRLDLLPGAYDLHAVDRSGRHLAPAPDDRVGVTVEASDLAGVDLELDPAAGSLGGRILDATSGAPLAGAWAVAFGESDVPVAAARTDARGRFEVPSLAPGDYRVLALDPSGAHRSSFRGDTQSPTTSPPVTVEAGVRARASATRLVRRPAGSVSVRVAGRVTATTSGVGLAGALVVAVREGTFRVRRAGASGADGRFSLRLPEGSWSVLAIDPDGRHGSSTAPVPAGSASTVDLAVAPTTGRLGGHITDAPVGAPQPGALVLAVGPGGATRGAVVGPDGSYRIGRLVPGEHHVTVIPPDDVAATDYGGGAGSPGAAVPVTVGAGAVVSHDAALVRTYPVTLDEGIPYREALDWHGDPVTLHLDLYRPQDAPGGPRPVLVFVYGGGWCYGDREQLAAAAAHYAALGYVTASIDYRMRSDALCSFPDDPGAYLAAMEDSTEDLLGALAFLRSGADRYGVDPGRTAALGWSAGGTTSLRQELAGVSGSADAIVSASGILPASFGPLGTSLRPALMINWAVDDGFVNYVPDPAADCARLAAAPGGSCTLHLLDGTGHAVDFVEQAPLVVPFLAEHLGGSVGVEGAVTQAGSGAPVEDAAVVGVASDGELIAATRSRVDGGYALDLPPGSYRLEFVDLRGRHRGEWYDDVPLGDAGAATLVPVDGLAASRADAVLEASGPSGIVTGQVTESGTGDALAGVWAVLVRRGDGRVVAGGVTGADGSFRLPGLVAGAYRLVVVDATRTHANELYWQDRADFPTADDIVVVSGAETDIDPVLDAIPAPVADARIEGVVRSSAGGVPVAGAMVGAVHANSGTFTGGAVAGTDGRYVLTLPTGPYRIIVVDPTGDQRGEWFGDVDLGRYADAAIVGATATGAVADLDLEPLIGSVGGTVRDAVSGAPIPGAWVVAVRAADGGIVDWAASGSDGAFRIDGLDPQVYRVAVVDPTGAHDPDLFFDDRGDFAAGDDVVVTAGATTHIEPDLEPR